MIEDLLQKELDFDFCFADKLFKENTFSEEDQELVNFLVQKLSFIYGCDYNKDNPFIPVISFSNGNSSAALEELTNEDIRYISDLLEKTNHPLLRGRFYDILGIFSKNKDYILNAANCFYDYFINSISNARNHNLCGAFKRSLFLFWKVNKKEFWQKLDAVFKSVGYKDFDQKIVFYYTAIKILQEVKQNLKQNHVDIIEAEFLNVYAADDPVLEIIRELANYYKKAHNSIKAKFWRIRFANICIDAEKKFRHGYSFLQKAINVLDANEDIDKINELYFLLEKSQKKAYNEMQFVNHELDGSILYNVKQYEETCDKTFRKSATGASQFICFLNKFHPVSIQQINEIITIQENPLFLNCCNTVLFDVNGLIIYDSSTATSAEKEEYQTSQAIQQLLPFSVIILNKWQKYRIIDESLKVLLREIISHNLFVPKDRINTVYDIILRGLEENKLRLATFELIAQFENGCRFYLKEFCNSYPIIYKGNTPVSIDLNHILVQKASKINNNRNKIVEVIGEDLTLNIEYIACRKLSGNLRNHNYHYGYDNPNEYNIYEFSLFFLLIKAYCLGFDETIN